MDPELENFLNAVKTKRWQTVSNLLPTILSNPGIDKRTVLSAIEDLYPTVVEDMLNIKMGRQALKKYKPAFYEDNYDSDDDLESGDYATTLQRMPAAQAKAEEQSKKVTALIESLREKLSEEEKAQEAQNVARLEAEHAAWAAAEGRQLQQQQEQERLSGKKRSRGDHGGKSRRKTAKKTKKRKTVKRRKTNKRKTNKKRR
jgi:hypothetical protein